MYIEHVLQCFGLTMYGECKHLKLALLTMVDKVMSESFLGAEACIEQTM